MRPGGQGNATVGTPAGPEHVREDGARAVHVDEDLTGCGHGLGDVPDLDAVRADPVGDHGGPESEVLRLQRLAYGQIVTTLTPSRAAGVRFRLDGADLEVPRGDNTLTAAPLPRDDYAALLAPASAPPSLPPSPAA